MSENAEATARLRTSLCEKEMEKEAAIAKINALEADRKILLEVSKILFALIRGSMFVALQKTLNRISLIFCEKNLLML